MKVEKKIPQQILKNISDFVTTLIQDYPVCVINTLRQSEKQKKKKKLIPYIFL